MLKIISPLLFSLLIFSCGGGGGGSGGGGGGSSSAPASRVGIFGFIDKATDSDWLASEAEADVFRTTEYNAQWGLEAIHAAEAYAVLDKNSKTEAGSGVKIAVIDSGIDASHVDFDDGDSNNVAIADSFNYIDNNTAISDPDGHGTEVSSIAAAIKNDTGIHGVAYKSQIIAAKSVTQASGAISDVLSAITDSASKANIKVINASIGYGSYSSYDGSSESAGFTDSNFISTLNSEVKGNDLLIVVAAGNDGDNYNDGQTIFQNPSYLSNPKPSKPALFANNAGLAGYVLSVVSVDEDGEISDFSNICGVTKNYCLAAPGEAVAGSFQDDLGDDFVLTAISGTSFAAPFVSGAAAVIRAAWPHLTAAQTSQLLLVTATDFGETGIDELYGRGMLNLYAATQDVGPDNVVSGSSVSSQGFTASSSLISYDPIFGDAFPAKVAPALEKAVFFDYFGRDYKAFLGKKISPANSSRSISYNINNILLNEYETKINPFSFALFSQDSKTKVTLKSRNKSANYFKYISRDNSQDIENQNSQGFSLSQDLNNSSSFGISFNLDQIRNSQNDALNNLGFLSLNSLKSNPFQAFINENSGANFSGNPQKNFNQFFVNHKLFQNKLKLGFSHQSSYFNNSGNASAISRNNNLQNQVSDISLDVNFKNTNFSTSFGQLEEFDNNFLNSKALGVFQSSSDAKTSYIKFSITQNLFQDRFLIANISEGRTQIDGNEQGVFRNFSNIKSRALALGLIDKNFFGAKIGLIYSEPMRVYDGKVSINIPVARDIEGNVTRFQDQVSLKPIGKEQNIEFIFAKNFDNFSTFSMNFLAIKDSQNIKRQGLDYLAIANYGLRF